jgi:hypothetical protein
MRTGAERRRLSSPRRYPFSRPPPTTTHSLGAHGNRCASAAIAAAVNAASVAAPSWGDNSCTGSAEKALRSRDFGPRCRKYSLLSRIVRAWSLIQPAAAIFPPSSYGAPQWTLTQSSISAFPGPQSHAYSSSPSIKVTFETPPMFKTAIGCGIPHQRTNAR